MMPGSAMTKFFTRLVKDKLLSIIVGVFIDARVRHD